MDLLKNKKEALPNIKNIIAVASGKGGVGKSTVAVNLAIALSKKGASVGLLDADIYGPSIPIMLDTELYEPATITIDDKNLLVPAEKYGIKIISVGYFVSQNNALIWRGPMASSAIKQLIAEVNWGELDYLIIDLPPGTGDIHLTIVQNIDLTGAIIVTTPQKISLADATKAINMFKQPQINVPVLGIIENMAYFTPAEIPNNKYYIFGKDGGKNFADINNIELLGQIPIIQSICESGDNGLPIAFSDEGTESIIFSSIADKVIERTALLNELKEITNVDMTDKICKCKE
jgi:ATP-binding protein involved in chromosome partitioning